MANPTPESILKLASYQFYNPKLLERESRLDSTATDCHDDPNETVHIRFGVQFWPGDKGKATWFFTWDTSPTTQRVLVPDVYGTLKARTIKKADLIFGESEVPPPARDVYTGQAVIWVVEWPLGSSSLLLRKSVVLVLGLDWEHFGRLVGGFEAARAYRRRAVAGQHINQKL